MTSENNLSRSNEVLPKVWRKDGVASVYQICKRCNGTKRADTISVPVWCNYFTAFHQQTVAQTVRQDGNIINGTRKNVYSNSRIFDFASYQI